MEETAENREARAHWMIKNARVVTRLKALNCASKREINLADWMDDAVANQDRIDAGTLILPPDVRPKPGAGPEVAQMMAATERVLAAATLAAQASGTPMPPRLRGQCNAVLNAYLRAERGMPPLKPPQKTIGGAGKPKIALDNPA